MKNNYIKILLIVILVFIFGTVNVNAKTVCKRAKTLHTEICNKPAQTVTCSVKYGPGEKVPYGNLGTLGTLKTGDAFDCDVNGDGNYDADTERFYYVIDLQDNTNYAVLIYYNNVIEGIPNSNTGYAYDSDRNPSVNGPKTLLGQLPTTTQWKNINLYKTTRQLTDPQGTIFGYFSYEGHTARLITEQEIRTACNVENTYQTTLVNAGCQYLLENTLYAKDDGPDYYWLENPLQTDSDKVYYLPIPIKYPWYGPDSAYSLGVRPAIEVKKSEIEDFVPADDPSTDPTQVVTVPDTAASVSKIILVNAIICILIGITIISLNTIHKRKRN